MSTKDPQSSELTLARRFHLRAVELAKQGHLGALKTRNLPLQKAYSAWVSLLEHTDVPVLLFGEPGSGKSRHVQEYFVLHQFHSRLQGLPQGRLLVFRSEFLVPGFTKTLLDRDVADEDVVVIEALHALGEALQTELLGFLQQRKQNPGSKRFRLIVTTEKALSVAVLRKHFDRELFQELNQLAVFLPSLHERVEDHPLLLRELLSELGASPCEPSLALVDAMSRHLWPGNLSELKRALASLLAQQRDPRLWTYTMLSRWGAVSDDFEPIDTKLLEELSENRRLLQSTLLEVGGDRKRAAERLGWSREVFLRRLMQMGLR
jgi:DNA-binding NtrC family response regulator